MKDTNVDFIRGVRNVGLNEVITCMGSPYVRFSFENVEEISIKLLYCEMFAVRDVG